MTRDTARGPVRAVVFDFDGTLALLNVDFTEMRRRIRGCIARYGVSSDGFEGLYVLEMVEKGASLIAEDDPGAREEFSRDAHGIIRELEIDGASRGHIFPGVIDMIHTLKEQKIGVGIVTRNCEEAVSVLYPHIMTDCDAVITREYTRRVKPDPDHLLTALRRLDAAAHESVMVGDHPMDISTGKDVGTLTVGVLSGYADREMMEKSAPDLIIDRAPDLIREGHIVNINL